MPCMSDSTFLHIENAAHGGAFGNNTIPEPTEAQCIAGNYKVGRANLYGLPIAIEQPRGSYRTGIDAKTGKRWASRMAAHYGYISGTKGADDDAVDCFIGFYPQSETAYVINQNVGGRFDEHKVMLAFPDEDTARRAYLDSYERGWNGLASLVPASISQLKWWLKNGDLRRPLRADNLPHEGLETMTRKVQWNSDALPYDNTLDHVLYEIRCADAGEGLLMDAVTAQEITEDADGLLAFDALVSPYAKLERKMELLRGVMERTGDKVKPVAMQITEPFKQRGVANVAAIFELSDGQTVTIFFHNPDVTPNKMAPADEVISWKWLLNKKDITIVVAPERGADLNIREVARRIMRLAEKNSPAFQRLNAKRAERMGAIQGLKDEIAGLEAELAAAQHELEVAKVDAEDTSGPTTAEEADALAAALEAPPQPDEQALIDAYFKSWGEEAAQINAAVAAINWEGITDTASAAAEMQKLRDAANSDRPIKKARDALEAIGIKSWDDRLASVTDSPGFKAQGDAMDAYRAATDKIQAVAKEKLIEAGKAELAALPEGAPLADVARAVFRKNGIDIGQRGEGWVARVVQQIEAKDADGLREILAGVGSDSNKASMEIFERATGVKLAKTQRERGRQIDEWAGITPEKRAELEAAKDAAWLARERERKVKESWDALKAMNVRNNGTGVVSDGQQYLLSQVAGGYDTVGSFKRGAATVYGLEKGTDLVFVNNRTFTNFLKSAIAFGGLRQALRLVGAVEPKAAEAQGGAEQIAAVDAAYKFESATDSFKLWLHESLNKADYSPFVTAKAMDEAAKRHGATVEWDKALAALDDVGHAVASLEASLAVVENNAPINQAEGDILQAGLETETAKSIREAIATLTEADYAPSEEDIGGMFEAESTTLDSADGAYLGVEKQAISATKALLQYFRDFIASDAKFAKVPESAYGWTAAGEIMDKDEAKRRLRSLIDIAINRKAGIPDLTPEQDKRLADYAHDARTISDYLTKRIRHTGARNLLRTPEMKAKYPHIDNQPRDGFDSVSLDGIDSDGYVGKVKKGGEVIGRIDIADDGKAMVYVGAAGDERVVFPSGTRAMYSDDDAVLMVDALFSMREAAKRGAGDGQADPQKDADRALFQSVIDGTVADILAPELADDLEAAYTRNQGDAELAALFEQAVAAYQAAMMAATSSLA